MVNIEKGPPLDEDDPLQQRIPQIEKPSAAWKTAGGAQDSLPSRTIDFYSLAENAIEAIFVINDEGCFEYVNERAAELLGYPREALLGRHFLAVIHPYDVSLVSTRWQARLRGETVPDRYEIQIVRKDGLSIPIEMSVTLTQWNGKPATLALAHDITPRRELENALGAELRLKTTIAELSKELLSAFDLEKLSEATLHEALQYTQSPLGFIAYLKLDNGEEIHGMMVRADPQTGEYEKYIEPLAPLQPFWDWVCRAGKAVYCNDFTEAFGTQLLPNQHRSLSRLLVAPAKVEQRVLGILAVADAPQPYRSTDVELLERFADLYALALQRHWQEEALRLESRRAASLAEIGQQVVACQRDLALLLETVARLTAEALQASCILLRGGAPANALHLAAVSHPNASLLAALKGVLEPLQRSSEQALWQEFIRDPQAGCWAQETDIPPQKLNAAPLQQIHELLGIHSLLILPLSEGDSLLGFMILSRHKGEKAFSKQEFTFAQEVANRLSMGMITARLMNDLEVQQMLLAQRVAERTAELETERAFVLQVMNSIEVGITVVGRDGKFRFVNRAYADMLGYTVEELIGRNPPEVSLAEHAVVHESQWQNRLQGKQTTYENILLHKDGTPIPVLISAAPRRQGNEIVGSIAVITDLRQRKLLEEEEFWLQGFRDLLLAIARPLIEGVTLQDGRVIEGLLAEVGKYLGVDRVYLFAFDWQHHTMSNTHEWVAEGVSAEKENLQAIPNDRIPIWVETLRREPYLLISEVAALQGEWSEVKAILEAQAIQSLLVVPIRAKEKLYGYIGFDSVKEKRQWKENEIYLLTILANQFAGLFVRQETEQAQRESEARYRLLAENIRDVVWTTDLDFNYTYISPSVTALTGYTVEEAMQLTLKEMLAPASYRVAKEAILDEMRKLWRLNPTQQRAWSRVLELEHRRKDGSTCWMEDQVSLLLDGEAKPIGFLGLSRDISERRQARQVLEYMATHDELTGLPNRYLFNDRLKQALKRARREKRALAVCLIDLDHFKELNDTLGHHRGDLVLQEVARRLLSALRQSDTVARMGGDEFCVILEDLVQPADAGNVAQKLLHLIAEPYTVEERMTWELSASIGISLYPHDGEEAEELMIAADIAMYRAKKRRNRYRFYSYRPRKNP